MEWARHRVVNSIALDSREVGDEGLWLALQGTRGHALDHLADARGRGAVAVLAEPAGQWDRDRIAALAGEVPVIAVPGLRRQAGEIAARFFGQPAQAMRIVGVTGTNGKTSVASFLAQALSTRVPTAVLGTVGNGFPGDLAPSSHTTLDAVNLHATLEQLFGRGARAVAMEVSSHALDQERVAGVPFHTAVFTNLTRDHQDYHGSMQAYAEAKKRLFRRPGLSIAVINVDDGVGAHLATEVRPRVFTVCVGHANDAVRLGDRYLQIRDVETRADGLRIRFESSWGPGELQSHLLGAFNATNLCLALAVLLAWDMPPGAAMAALNRVQAVAGRMMAFVAPRRPRVVVDYAHTPDALEQALEALRGHVEGRLICVFGCGGDRDRGKRPQMGEVAQRLADLVVLTDDNPRSENPRHIVTDILSGIEQRDKVRVEHDRAAAIRSSIAAARPDDLVLVAGKGHEDYQESAGERRPFSDIEQVQLALGGEA
ncbi:MAG: UDP-N-acetylmuramoyl-L-alanyl-D-glutamate--2,6-diaminopimelate ligase [Chromatiaceae bacterium]|nr:UDP-N-acetylmuramoyl-L-alanyl-D-glutamate--2,6-diaminopimelate ligase [Gammaproteobacteria bacterium]MCP5298340.1 UDP-N-acetylmuramoyl-L-alanyl-D-glutamate--2,6-diaminopimelate ligase [Chromatiaceae bacterium]MCP5423120.1 UDP-N-acetylmuramoyl-L-alanyl-D-glutamate--2,6-diaminopimelate ligase [Chromatiaceae bacterium]